MRQTFRKFSHFPFQRFVVAHQLLYGQHQRILVVVRRPVGRKSRIRLGRLVMLILYHASWNANDGGPGGTAFTTTALEPTLAPSPK